MKNFLLFTLLTSATAISKADYTDHFAIRYNGEVVNAGEVLICTNMEDNTDIDDGYSYEALMLIQNKDSGQQSFTGTLLWGTKPTKEEYLAQKNDIFDGDYFAYVWGQPTICGYKSFCFNAPEDNSNLGSGPSVASMLQEAGFSIHLNTAPETLVSEYKLEIKSDSHADACFECSIIFASNREAAEEFISQAGIESVEKPSDEPVVYYNLNGQRVLHPEKGIYIRRQGSTVSKVIF